MFSVPSLCKMQLLKYIPPNPLRELYNIVFCNINLTGKIVYFSTWLFFIVVQDYCTFSIKNKVLLPSLGSSPCAWAQGLLCKAQLLMLSGGPCSASCSMRNCQVQYKLYWSCVLRDSWLFPAQFNSFKLRTFPSYSGIACVSQAN